MTAEGDPKESGSKEGGEEEGEWTPQSFEPEIVRRSSFLGQSQHVREQGRSRLRDFGRYEKCVILPDDRWKMKWNLGMVG